MDGRNDGGVVNKWYEDNILSYANTDKVTDCSFFRRSFPEFSWRFVLHSVAATLAGLTVIEFHFWASLRFYCVNFNDIRTARFPYLGGPTSHPSASSSPGPQKGISTVLIINSPQRIPIFNQRMRYSCFLFLFPLFLSLLLLFLSLSLFSFSKSIKNGKQPKNSRIQKQNTYIERIY